jgi:hypothetical protein
VTMVTGVARIGVSRKGCRQVSIGVRVRISQADEIHCRPRYTAFAK